MDFDGAIITHKLSLRRDLISADVSFCDIPQGCMLTYL
jgi:hypothetical protein